MNTREKLHRIANNVWWSWNPEAIGLFKELNPDVFAASGSNPITTLRYAHEGVLSSTHFAAEVDAQFDRLSAYMADEGELVQIPSTAYFCMEYGLHESLPLYSGGLGILAGDHTKAASDLGLRFTAVGLFLREGYFKQYFSVAGLQQADYPCQPVTALPAELIVDDQGEPIFVVVNLGLQPVTLQAWLVQVGRSRLILLDSDVEPNPFPYRFLTRRLYAGSRRTRIRQEMLLGIGGLRMIRALGIAPEKYHMNEGHCAFLALELLREKMSQGLTRPDAERWVREHSVFTTHTPVKAGHDRFDPGLVLDQMSQFRTSLGLSEGDLMAYGRANPSDLTEPFTMT
ncbi:MAG: alpha-glucan family phosphorylase, partial [Rhodothermales bacterium]|nr:alpha-glucan family phosphorylase [Rhodothermales bacterium]